MASSLMIAKLIRFGTSTSKKKLVDFFHISIELTFNNLNNKTRSLKCTKFNFTIMYTLIWNLQGTVWVISLRIIKSMHLYNKT